MGVNKDYHDKAMKTNYEKVKHNVDLALELKKYNVKMDIVVFSHRLKGASLSQWNDFATSLQDRGAKIAFGPLWNRAGWYGKELKKRKVY